MDINEFILSVQQMAPQMITSCCIVNRTVMNLQEIENMGYNKFSYSSKINMPLKLYKYFPNKEGITDDSKVNYSIQALKNNTVFMQSPSNFDDVYDSEIDIDFSEYHKLRLLEYCKRCGIEINDQKSIEEVGNVFTNFILDSINKYKDYEHIFIKKPVSHIEELANTLFKNNLIIGLNHNNDLSQVVFEIICKEYEKYIKELKNTFRVSCFATTPFSQLMWSGYADYHRGFCLEYTVLPDDERYKDIYYNLFPMVYCKTRPDITERIVRAKDKDLTEEDLWDIYFHGALRKSVDWAFQDEWRLLLPMRKEKSEDYNIKFFPITKVFLGNRMLTEKRKEIIDFCNSRNIPYIGVKRNANMFEMEECSIKCEDCPNYFDNIK
ncbi:MAG: DUF2971 domain-containing protein [Clostridia bacterium]|jgi:hypothetical protein|nr:DUF2971 domain-containing protein [Clostridia bacterium]